MKEWQDWEIELLETYKKQATTVEIIAKLLGRSTEDIKEKMKSLESDQR